MVGEPTFYKRKGQRISRTEAIQGDGATWSSLSVPRWSQRNMHAMVWRTNEAAGSDQSKPDDQRRTVEASGTRSASFSFGEAFSHEQCSAKRLHNAWQRANKLKWVYGSDNSGRKVKVVPQIEQRPRRIPIQS
jgi:hypothetical protein